MGRLVLVLPALHRSEERPGADRSGARKSLDAGRPVHRRRRARRAASALLALLAQGAVRSAARQHARAVHEAGQPGNDPGRDGDHRLSGREPAAGSAPRRRRRMPKASRSARRPAADRPYACRRIRVAKARRRVSCSTDASGDPPRQPRLQNVEEPRQRRQSRRRGRGIRRRFAAAVRNVHGPARSRQAVEHGGRERRARLSGPRVADDHGRAERNAGAERRDRRHARRRPSRTACCTTRSRA